MLTSRTISYLFAFVTVVISGCDVSSLPSPSALISTPELAAAEHLSTSQRMGSINGFTIQGARSAGDRAVVFSEVVIEAITPNSSRTTYFYTSLMREAGEWFAYSSVSGNDAYSLSQALVCGNVEFGQDSIGYYTIVMGHVRVPDVQSVEVEYSDGATRTDTTTDGLFAAIRDGNRAPTELHLLDDNKQVLHSITLPVSSNSVSAPLPGGNTEGIGFGCYP